MAKELNQYEQPLGDLLTDWTQRLVPPKIVMEGRNCRLEPIKFIHHASDLYKSYYENVPDDRDWTYLSVERPATQMAFFDLIKEMEENETFQHYAIIDLKSKLAVGSVALMRIEPENGSLEIGFVNFSPRLARQTAATEAIYLLLIHTFDELNYRRCEWKCDSLNARSRKAALRFGFQYEGTFRNHMVRKQRSRDSEWYSMIDQDWPQVKKAFDRWLNPANFDKNGQQCSRLEILR